MLFAEHPGNDVAKLQFFCIFLKENKQKSGMLSDSFWNVLIKKFDLSVQPSVKFIINWRQRRLKKSFGLVDQKRVYYNSTEKKLLRAVRVNPWRGHLSALSQSDAGGMDPRFCAERLVVSANVANLLWLAQLRAVTFSQSQSKLLFPAIFKPSFSNKMLIFYSIQLLKLAKKFIQLE